jgi:hypothetical protein
VLSISRNLVEKWERGLPRSPSSGSPGNDGWPRCDTDPPSTRRNGAFLPPGLPRVKVSWRCCDIRRMFYVAVERANTNRDVAPSQET